MARVVALSAGFFHGKRIRPGVEFEAGDAKGKWFVPVESAPAPAPQKAERRRTLAELAKAPAVGPTDELA